MPTQRQVADIQTVQALLGRSFPSKHVNSALKHYSDAIKKYRDGDWESTGLKAGKFVEATTKCLMVYCGKPLPVARNFKAGNELRNLQNASSGTDVIRIAIPKACLCIYEITNNRGSRHDADDVDANEMDAKVLIPLLSWVVAELVRFSSTGSPDPASIWALIESLTEKIYPMFEEIDGRSYINLDQLSAPEVGLLILYFQYPKRIERQALVESIHRHGHKKKAAEVAVHRLKNLVDDENGSWKLRGLGRQKAEAILQSH